MFLTFPTTTSKFQLLNHVHFIVSYGNFDIFDEPKCLTTREVLEKGPPKGTPVETS